ARRGAYGLVRWGGLGLGHLYGAPRERGRGGGAAGDAPEMNRVTGAGVRKCTSLPRTHAPGCANENAGVNPGATKNIASPPSGGDSSFFVATAFMPARRMRRTRNHARPRARKRRGEPRRYA